MDEKRNRKTPRLQTFDYNSIGAYFITICTKNRQPILSKIKANPSAELIEIELTEYGKIAQKYLNQINNFYNHILIDSFVIMPNHIHVLLIITKNPFFENSITPKGDSLFSQFVSTFKRFCNKEIGANIWQSRSHDHIIRDKRDYEKHVQYILENPSNWLFDDLYSE